MQEIRVASKLLTGRVYPILTVTVQAMTSSNFPVWFPVHPPGAVQVLQVTPCVILFADGLSTEVVKMGR